MCVTLTHRALADVEAMEKLFTKSTSGRMSLHLEISSQQERTWSYNFRRGRGRGQQDLSAW